MDYPYFTAAPQPYQYLRVGLPPTPVHNGSANSDDYSNSPPVRDQFLNAHSYSGSLLTLKQDAFDNFSNPYGGFDHFGNNSNSNSNGLPVNKPPTPVSQHKASISNGIHQNYEVNGGDVNNTNQQGSNSDDDDNMTPAQSRRKAQNRAAQRAFRERKERHVKDLEAKLDALQKTNMSVAEENEALKLQLQKATTENEILKATSAHNNHRGGSEPLPNAGPLRYSPIDFYTEVLHAHENKTPSHRIVTSDNGDRLLAAGATWDYIIKHPLYIKGMVDVGDVSERLKKVAKCDGQGPVFEERDIINAIELSIASGNDQLM